MINLQDIINYGTLSKHHIQVDLHSTHLISENIPWFLFELFANTTSGKDIFNSSIISVVQMYLSLRIARNKNWKIFYVILHFCKLPRNQVKLKLFYVYDYFELLTLVIYGSIDVF